MLTANAGAAEGTTVKPKLTQMLTLPPSLILSPIGIVGYGANAPLGGHSRPRAHVASVVGEPAACGTQTAGTLDAPLNAVLFHP